MAHEVDRSIGAAHAAFRDWRSEAYASRARPMQQAAEVLKKRKADLARLMTLEMGKPIVQAEAEVEKCAWTCEYYAEQA